MVEAPPNVTALKLPLAYLIVVVLSVPFHKPFVLLVCNVPLMATVPPAGEVEFVFNPMIPQINVAELLMV